MIIHRYRIKVNTFFKISPCKFFALVFSCFSFSGALLGSAASFFPDETLYTSDPVQLSAQLDTLLSESKSSLAPGNRILGLIVPHANYDYSGSVAAEAYNKLKNQSIKYVILIGPCHDEDFKGASISAKGTFDTPLGSMPISKTFSKRVKKRGDLFHEPPSLHDSGNSLKMQIPFLQKVLPDAQIIPILINNRNFSCKLAQGLRRFLERRSDVIVIATTDLAHHHNEPTTRALDMQTIHAIQKGDPLFFSRLLKGDYVELCADAALLTFLELKKILRRGEITLLDYKNSSRVTQNPDSSVGYASFSWETNDESDFPVRKLSREDKEALKNKLTNTLTDYINNGTQPQTEEASDPTLNGYSGVFVTIKTQDGQMKSMAGTPFPPETIWNLSQNLLIQAATQASPALTPEDLSSLSITVSLVSPLQQIEDPTDFKLGIHGIFLQNGSKNSIILPDQEGSFSTKSDLLSSLCTTAGLNSSDWNLPDTEVYRFKVKSF